MCFWREATELSIVSITLCQGYVPSTRLTTADLHRLAEWCLPGFVTANVPLFSFFPFCNFGEEVTTHNPHSGSEESRPPLWGQSIHINFLFPRRVTCSVHLFYYFTTYLLCYCKLMDIFIVWVRLTYHLFCCSHCSGFSHWEHFQLVLHL